MLNEKRSKRRREATHEKDVLETWGQHECLNKGVKLRRKTLKKFSSTQSL